MIEILFIITFISFLLIIIGLINNWNILRNSGIVLFFGTLVIGWLCLGILNSRPVEIKSEQKIVKTKNSINIIANGREFNFNKKIDFDNISDTTTFYLFQHKNIYGITMRKSGYYIFDNHKFYAGK